MGGVRHQHGQGIAVEIIHPEDIDGLVSGSVGIAADEDAAIGRFLVAIDGNGGLASTGPHSGGNAVVVSLGRDAG